MWCRATRSARRASASTTPLRGDRTEQIRGGIGLFNGRTPYVWLSNQFGNTGIEFTRIGAGNNANNQHSVRRRPVQPADDRDRRHRRGVQNEIDVIDPDYKYPSIMRGNLGDDRSCPGAWLARPSSSGPGHMQDIGYQNLNLRAVRRRAGSGGRAVHTPQPT